MSNIKIKGKDYDLEGAFSNPELNALMFLKQHEGMTLKDLYSGFQLIGKAEEEAEAAREAGSPDAPSAIDVVMDLLSDMAQLNAFRGFVWLLKTNAGERAADGRFFTIEQANEGLGFQDLEFPEEVEVEANPKEESEDLTAVPSS